MIKKTLHAMKFIVVTISDIIGGFLVSYILAAIVSSPIWLSIAASSDYHVVEDWFIGWAYIIGAACILFYTLVNVARLSATLDAGSVD